jgi:transposase, IS5 family
MSTDDFFRARLDGMVDPRHPLVVLGTRLPWAQIEATLAPLLAHKQRSGRVEHGVDLFGPTLAVVGSGVSNAGRPRLPARLMVSLLYLKHAFNLSDEELVERWSENVVWQHFSGNEYYQPRPPCDATQIGRFRGLLGEEGVEHLLKTTIEAGVGLGAISKEQLARVIVDSTVQEKAVAHPTDSRLLEKARAAVVRDAQRAGVRFTRTHELEAKRLQRKASGYAHAKQMRRLDATHKRQRTLLGRLLRHVDRQQAQQPSTGRSADRAVDRLKVTLERAKRIHAQRRADKNKLYAMHAPEVECIGKGKARKPYEFGVKVSLAVTLEQGLVVGARSYPGNPYDGHTLAGQVEQSNLLLQDLGVKVKTAVTDLGYRGVEKDNPGLHIVHRGKAKGLSEAERGWLKRRQAIEPVIGHAKADHGMLRCWLKGSTGDALHAVLCAAGFNIRWLMRAIVRLGLKGLLLRLLGLLEMAGSAASAAASRWAALLASSAAGSALSGHATAG